MKTIEKAQNTKENIEALEKQIDDNSKIGLALLWVLDDAPGNTNAYRVTADAADELAALREAVKVASVVAKQAQLELRSTQINWQEDCLFRCDDLLTGVIAKLEAK
jgi:hypothetical protein